jgi:YHS domain-containing protein
LKPEDGMHRFTYILIILSAIVIAAAGGFSFYFMTQTYFADSVIYDTDDNVALNGYDIVAYHKERTAVKGTYLYQVTWKGATWHFSDLEYRNEFAKTPRKFEPEFGGYDAFGVTKGRTYPTDQEVFTFKEGKVYFFHSLKTKEQWAKDIGENIEKGRSNWGSIRRNLEYFAEQKKIK